MAIERQGTQAPPTLRERGRRLFHALLWLSPSMLAALIAALFWSLSTTTPLWIRTTVLVLALASLAMGLRQMRRWADIISRLEAALRGLASGRLESRAPSDLPPAFSRLGAQMNAISQQMLGYRDQLEQRMRAAVNRLRRDLEHANADLRVTQNHLAEAQRELRQQSELFSSLTHELRTPLTGILGFADLLRKTRLDQEQGDYLATLDRSARGLLSMLNDVLDWSRIEAGRLTLNVERFDLADAVEDVVALLAPLAYEKNLELVHIIYHDVPLQLDGDPQRLRQILTNLLSNAIKFTESGEVVLRVMKERRQGHRFWLRASVTDSGVGISAAQRERIFQPFEQAGGRSVQPGSGLGLTIVKRLAELMAGSVSVESEPGRGSTFSVLLELRSLTEASPAWEHLRGRRIWVIDTHPTASLALSHSLQFWGIEVLPFDDVTQLAARLRHSAPKSRPDVVIVGLKPAELADPAIEALGTLCMEAQPPLLALLSSASPVDQQQAIDIGAARALPKAVSRLQLYRELCELVRSGHSVPLLEGRKLLIADNNPANRRYLVALGHELGAQVVEADDGDAALQRWREHDCDFALIDYRMPGRDGLGVIRAIRADEVAAKIPGKRPVRLVATSAHLSPDERASLRSAGADQVLIKPFDENQLLRALTPELAHEVPSPARASRLAQDAELLRLLREELPLQLKELEDAFSRGDAIAARAAAHTLNGTAAFYQLHELKSAARDMEEQLAASAFAGVGAGGLARLRTALHDTLGTITAEGSATGSSESAVIVDLESRRSPTRRAG
ncbi:MULTISPECIES: ATP-binding protein [Hydrocarboniphaga]|uniref:histidine kinase n=1 Tax=Hydrocarboniphaga effusa AP103 TaxID=1172194 RepID=I8T8X2_9GAMM|nr:MULTISPECIES: ATP-binding protein [Hydrocarboniphaga]EIT70415.1 hypothetical protein WQQ_05520 [Hydrocarboniphaga effusa AP103]MDZ4078326.1 ATP-binding protein [Hydrocarboniphaga sp.]